MNDSGASFYNLSNPAVSNAHFDLFLTSPSKSIQALFLLASIPGEQGRSASKGYDFLIPEINSSQAKRITNTKK